MAKSEACPKCGFAYAWDGEKCGHCGASRQEIAPAKERLSAQRDNSSLGGESPIATPVDRDVVAPEGQGAFYAAVFGFALFMLGFAATALWETIAVGMETHSVLRTAGVGGGFLLLAVAFVCGSKLLGFFALALCYAAMPYPGMSPPVEFSPHIPGYHIHQSFQHSFSFAFRPLAPIIAGGILGLAAAGIGLCVDTVFGEVARHRRARKRRRSYLQEDRQANSGFAEEQATLDFLKSLSDQSEGGGRGGVNS